MSVRGQGKHRLRNQQLEAWQRQSRCCVWRTWSCTSGHPPVGVRVRVGDARRSGERPAPQWGSVRASPREKPACSPAATCPCEMWVSDMVHTAGPWTHHPSPRPVPPAGADAPQKQPDMCPSRDRSSMGGDKVSMDAVTRVPVRARTCLHHGTHVHPPWAPVWPSRAAPGQAACGAQTLPGFL